MPGDLRPGRKLAQLGQGELQRGLDEAKRYNVIQKLTYAVVLFVLLPLQVLAGLAMSPAMDAAFPF
ncbi:hypothetical protein OMR07_04075, partial [Methylobacterium organophilum]|nr:hypothetical protein [Methylobacterium organophilum]